jgi:hypothetical protein
MVPMKRHPHLLHTSQRVLTAACHTQPIPRQATAADNHQHTVVQLNPLNSSTVVQKSTVVQNVYVPLLQLSTVQVVTLLAEPALKVNDA